MSKYSRIKQWVVFLLRNFFPLIARFSRLVLRFSIVEYFAVTEKDFENQNEAQLNSRKIIFEGLESAFAIRINSILIPVFKDGSYTVVLPLASNKSELTITFYGIRNKLKLNIKESTRNNIEVKETKPRLKFINHLNNDVKSISIESKKIEIKKSRLQSTKTSHPQISIETVIPKNLAFEINLPEIKVNSDLLLNDYQSNIK